MTRASPVPRGWIDGCTESHARLDRLIGSLTDDLSRRPSPLTGWTIGHLVTHLARNADSHTGMVHAAQRGEVRAQYPGGPAEREADIEAGSGRPSTELIEDVRAATRALEEAWASTDEETWATGMGRQRKGPASLADLAFQRWREVEVHLADLAPDLGGPGWDGLSATYVDEEWRRMTTGLTHRVPDDTTVLLVPGDRPSVAAGTGASVAVVRDLPGRILEWLFGRGGDPAWPALGPWN
jgi:maleylpyruvate isomerase